MLRDLVVSSLRRSRPPASSVSFPYFGALLQVGESVVQFLHKTRAEMTGSADTMGAGATVLMKGLVGGTFGSAAKITGVCLGWVHACPWGMGRSRAMPWFPATYFCLQFRPPLELLRLKLAGSHVSERGLRVSV